MRLFFSSSHPASIVQCAQERERERERDFHLPQAHGKAHSAERRKSRASRVANKTGSKNTSVHKLFVFPRASVRVRVHKRAGGMRERGGRKN